MTRALECSCCKKALKRIAQHLTHKPKCLLFLKNYIARLGATSLYNFKNSTLSNIGNVHNIKNESLIAEENHIPVEINFDFFPNETRDSCGIREPIGLDKDSLYSSGINYQHFVSNLNVQDGFTDSNFPIQIELLQLVESLSAPMQTYDMIMK